MDSDQFDRRLRELEAMIGSEAATDVFNQEYESLLNDVNALPGAKYEKLERMRRLIYKQFFYLFGEWQRAKAIQGSGQEAIGERMN